MAFFKPALYRYGIYKNVPGTVCLLFPVFYALYRYPRFFPPSCFFTLKPKVPRALPRQ